MFESVQLAPPDPIFGLVDAMRSDPRPDKINLGAGVYQDETGRTPILDVVKAAERRLLDTETTKSYLPIDGLATYDLAVRGLILGDHHPAVIADRAVTAQTPGGTGALRVVADMLRGLDKPPRIWVCDPTWANHAKIFRAAGIEQLSYPYYDPTTYGLAWPAMISTLEAGLRPGDVVLLHGCCHNPTGVDPTIEQWQALAELLEQRQAMPILDFAYQGFVDGVDEDAAGIRLMAQCLPEAIVCSSFSKNLGLYAERVGAVTVIADSPQSTRAVLSQIKRSIRANYSNPPTHGASIAATVLLDAELRQRWSDELAAMRERIQAMRRRFARGLDDRGVHLSPQGNAFIVEQNGMFSFCGLSKDQVLRLRHDHGVYMVDSGRLNVAGISDTNLDRLCDAFAALAGG